MVDVLTFVQSFLGKAGTGTNAANSGQCVGLVERWVTLNDHPAIPGNAVDLYANADAGSYAKTPNGPVNYPPKGAIVCWDGTWGGGYGHCAVVLAANAMQLVVFEQNDPEGAAPLVATHSYGGVSGWLTMR